MKIEDLVRQHLIEHGNTVPPNVEKIKERSFNASTEISTRKTTFQYDPDFKIPKRAQAYARMRKVTDGLEICTLDIIKHECGHIHNTKRISCPQTIEEHVEHFYDPMYQILEPKKKHGWMDDITNMVEDVIDNTFVVQESRAGLMLFYVDNAEHVKQISPVFDAYMRIQLACWGDKLDKRVYSPYFNKDPNDKAKEHPEVLAAVKQFLGAVAQDAKGRKRLSQKEWAEYCANKNNWKRIGVEFAKALEPLMNEKSMQEINLCNFGEQMAEEIGGKTVQEKIIRKRYDQHKEIPKWMDQQEALDGLYSSLARDIVVKVDASAKNRNMPIVATHHTPFDIDEHDIRNVDFKKPIIGESPFGLPLNFGVGDQHVHRAYPVSETTLGLPPLRLYCDVSGSMERGVNGVDPGDNTMIPWGNKSKYHYVVSTFYGIIQDLTRKRLLGTVDMGLGVFGSHSIVKNGLENAKKLLLNPQFQGSTHMSIGAIEKLLGGRTCVLFTLSDGELHNWYEIEDRFIEIARQNYFAHLQYGEDTDMTESLRKAGLAVYNVHSGEDLEHLGIDLTSKAYEQARLG